MFEIRVANVPSKEREHREDRRRKENLINIKPICKTAIVRHEQSNSKNKLNQVFAEKGGLFRNPVCQFSQSNFLGPNDFVVLLSRE